MEIPVECSVSVAKRLRRCRSAFERLALIASMRDRGTGRYADPDGAPEYSESAVHTALRYLHLGIFREWLGLTLRDQVAELDEFLPLPRALRMDAIRNWNRFSRYEELIPEGSALPERLLFVSDLDMDFSVLASAAEPANYCKPAIVLSWRPQLNTTG